MTLTGLEKARQNDFAKTNNHGNFQEKTWQHFKSFSIREKGVKKWFMRINLTLATIIILMLQVQAKRVYAQEKVTLHVKGVSLESVLEVVRKQTGYSYAVQDQYLGAGHPVSISVDGAPLKEVLDAVFRDQPYSYQIVDKIIVVKKKEDDKKLPSLNGRNLPGEVEGLVLNEAGQPLAQASIMIKETGSAVLTNENGGFTLRGLKDGSLLLVSYVGYQPKQVIFRVGAKLEIRLTVATSQLDKAQVIAYGLTTQRLSTGDVATISAREIEEQPVSNPLAAMEGRVPGLFITQNNGAPGGSFTVQIRGQNSIANGNDPFYVIDGVPYASQTPGSINPQLQGGSPLNFINPADIESIDVLKDADATAIYGSRAANGAILITTKKGKVGKTSFDAAVSGGVGKLVPKVNLLNTKQYLDMRNEAFGNDGEVPTVTSAPDLLFWDTTRYTNWQKTLIGNSATYLDALVEASGGSVNTQFLISGSYHREGTVMPVLIPGDGIDQKPSIHFNINHVSTDQRWKLSLSGSYLADLSTVQQATPMSTVVSLPPDAPAARNADGSLNWAPTSPGNFGTWSNPLANYMLGYKANTNNLVSNATISFTPVEGLEIKASLGYTNTVTNEITTIPTYALDPAYNLTSGFSTFNTNSVWTWIIEPQATYKVKIGKGVLTSLVGATFNKSNTERLQQNATGFSSDILLSDLQNATSVTIGSDINNLYKYDAVFARLGYSWENKYLVNITGRRDGSSRFGPQNQFANFGSIGAAWIFSAEPFLQTALPWISFGKFRVSYGTTGNDQIGDYTFLDLYSSTQYPYQNSQGLYPSSLYNGYLAWERTKKTEAGLDVGFLKDRLLIKASYYYNRSDNQLVSYPLSNVTGFNSIAANLPAAVENRGQEYLLTTVNVKTRNFQWKSIFNLTIPINRLLAFPNLATSSYRYQYKVGKPLSMQFAWHYAGVNDTTGVYQFTDAKGNLTYNPDYFNDRTLTISTAPRYYGGFQNSFQYKNLTLDVFLQFVRQTGDNFFVSYDEMPGLPFNQPNLVTNRWQKPGDSKPIEQFSQDYASAAFNAYNYLYDCDQAFSNASYLRLKNVSLSYVIGGDKWKARNHLQTLRVYLQGQNLLTITKYKGFDPETQRFNLPPLRVITGGVQVGF